MMTVMREERELKGQKKAEYKQEREWMRQRWQINRGSSQLQWNRDGVELAGRRGSWMMEDTVGLCDSDVIHGFKSQIILFYAHMNKANGAGKICKLLSNWPVSRLKPCQTTVREGESRSESNVENYWIGFSCHSQHISLSNFGSHHDHGSALSPWKSRFFQPSFREKRQRFSSLLYLTPPPVWLPPPNTDNARKQVFTGSHLCRRHEEDRFECRGGYKTLQWNKILKQE